MSRNTIIDGYSSFVVPKGGNEEDRIPTIYGEKIMLWNEILEHIGEKGLRVLHGKGMVEVHLIAHYTLISMHIVYMVNIIR